MYRTDAELRREEAQARVDEVLDRLEDATYSSDESRQAAQLRRLEEEMKE